jgi:hypothetical protein
VRTALRGQGHREGFQEVLITLDKQVEKSILALRTACAKALRPGKAQKVGIYSGRSMGFSKIGIWIPPFLARKLLAGAALEVGRSGTRMEQESILDGCGP